MCYVLYVMRYAFVVFVLCTLALYALYKTTQNHSIIDYLAGLEHRGHPRAHKKLLTGVIIPALCIDDLT